MWQPLVVTLFVVGATLYAAWALTPVRLRWRALTRIDAALARDLAPLWRRTLRENLLAPLLRRAASRGGGCDQCGAAAAAPPAAARPGAAGPQAAGLGAVRQGPVGKAPTS